ncbi:host cell division inhibitor Icd-like protein [Citrobacter freundii]|uniref:host cell division inhibitor Icd-like protein n=1 Tax=Citrobacter freundii TaxID=546 RepID=UPI003979E2AF
MTIKDLKCDSLKCSFKCKGAIHLVSAKPGSVPPLTGSLTKPLIGVTVMADQQHTQTRPEFTWLFLATPKHYPECAPVVLRFDADTEANARAAFPGWEFDSAASQEVRHA